jgi:hypothetical protein
MEENYSQWVVTPVEEEEEENFFDHYVHQT